MAYRRRTANGLTRDEVKELNAAIHVGWEAPAIGYIAKQMTPQAWYRRGMLRKPGGPIVGKRSGVTRDLDRHATALREAWSNAKPFESGYPPVRPIFAQSSGR
jgi:hypothetical protein